MIIVTGANGFIGSNLVHKLNALGYADLLLVDVVPIKDRPELLANAQYTTFLSPQEFNQWHVSSIECIFHLGAISNTTEVDWDKLYRNNVEFSESLALMANSHNAPFIYASSAAVYGDGSKGYGDTIEIEYEPQNLYGKSKLAFDKWISEKNPSSPWHGLRFFNVYGPNEYYKTTMASGPYRILSQVINTGKAEIFKSNLPEDMMRDFVYIKDIVRWMVEIFNNRNFASGIYNMGSQEARTWRDVAHISFTLTNKPIDIEYINMPDHIAKYYQYFTRADMSKAFVAGLSKPQFSLEDGMADLYRSEKRYK